MHFTDLSDDEVVTNLKTLCGDARRLLARLIAHLAEVQERRLDLRLGYSSLFDFSVRGLGMSEGEAFRRMTAARLVLRFPGLLAWIERGDIHLSALVLLRDHLTESSWEELVGAASHLGKRGVQELLAKRFPKPDIPSTLRKLPSQCRLATSPGQSSPPSPSQPSSLPSGQPSSLPPRLPSLPMLPVTAQASLPTGNPLPATSLPTATSPAKTLLEPLSEGRYRLQLTASAELRRKLERARDLMRHRNPSGDLAVVVERALDALLAQLEKERLGTTDRARPADQGTKAGHVTPRAKHGQVTQSAKHGHVARATRRDVFARDGEQCSYTTGAGQRCPSRAFLELDHAHPRALGGTGDASNVRVMCRAHNRLLAEQTFGMNAIARPRHLRQHKSESATDPQDLPAPTTD